MIPPPVVGSAATMNQRSHNQSPSALGAAGADETVLALVDGPSLPMAGQRQVGG